MIGTGTIAYGNTSRVFKKPISDKSMGDNYEGFCLDQVNLRETSRRPYSLGLTSCLPLTQEQWRKPSAFSLVWKRRKAEAEALTFLKRPRTEYIRDNKVQ